MLFFKCKVCEEKDKRIAELKEEILFLRRYVNPTQADPLPLAMEAQKILDGALSPIIEIRDPSKDLLKEYQDIQLERDKILTGAEIIE